jgi:hypothetical protein
MDRKKQYCNIVVHIGREKGEHYIIFLFLGVDKVGTFLLMDGSTKEAHDPDFFFISNKSRRQARSG